MALKNIWRLPRKNSTRKRQSITRKKKSREESLLGKIFQLKAEKSIWRASLELKEEKDIYSTNCEVLNKEVRQLREKRELLHSAQIGRLEEQVRQLSCQLEAREVLEPGPRSALPPSSGLQVDGRVG